MASVMSVELSDSDWRRILMCIRIRQDEARKIGKILVDNEKVQNVERVLDIIKRKMVIQLDEQGM